MLAEFREIENEIPHKERKYPQLNLTRTYPELIDWIKQEYQLCLIKKSDENIILAIDIYLMDRSSIEFLEETFPDEKIKVIDNFISSSFVRFEIVKTDPLILAPTHYYRTENSIPYNKAKHLVELIELNFCEKEVQGKYEETEKNTKFTMSMYQAPKTPDTGSSTDVWFDYYHEMKNASFKISLQDIAKISGYAYNTLKNYHAQYKIDKGIN